MQIILWSVDLENSKNNKLSKQTFLKPNTGPNFKTSYNIIEAVIT